MNKRKTDTAKTILIIFLIMIGAGMIDAIPWWSFLAPVLVLGMVIAIRQWQVAGFATGFLAGFIVWSGANLYYDRILHGALLARMGALLSVPAIVVPLLAGIIGGILTGLALYTGKSMFAYENISGTE